MLNISESGMSDGGAFIGSYTPVRNILLTVFLSSEKEKQRLYSAFSGKGILYYKSDYRNVKIECYVENIEIMPYNTSLTVTVSLICPQPFFKDIEDIKVEIAGISGDIEFPFEFLEGGNELSHKSESLIVNAYNGGDTEVPLHILFYANGNVINPELYNITTDKYMKINTVIQSGDIIEVSTERGNKTITLIRNNQKANMFNFKDKNAEFFSLIQGDNLLRYGADENSDGLEVTVYYSKQYQGV